MELSSNREGIALTNQRQKLATSSCVTPENTKHRRARGRTGLFCNSSHHHAEMRGFANNANAKGAQNRFNGFSNLLSHSFLHLQAASEHLHNSGKFGQAHDSTIWDITNMNFSEEGKHVMLT